MNERINELMKQANKDIPLGKDFWPALEQFSEKFAQLILADLADELLDVARGSKKENPEWANGVNHAAMLAQRMTMNLPKEEK